MKHPFMAVSGADTCMTKIGKNIVIKITDNRVDMKFILRSSLKCIFGIHAFICLPKVV